METITTYAGRADKRYAVVSDAPLMWHQDPLPTPSHLPPPVGCLREFSKNYHFPSPTQKPQSSQPGRVLQKDLVCRYLLQLPITASQATPTAALHHHCYCLWELTGISQAVLLCVINSAAFS